MPQPLTLDGAAHRTPRLLVLAAGVLTCGAAAWMLCATPGHSAAVGALAVKPDRAEEQKILRNKIKAIREAQAAHAQKLASGDYAPSTQVAASDGQRPPVVSKKDRYILSCVPILMMMPVVRAKPAHRQSRARGGGGSNSHRGGGSTAGMPAVVVEATRP